MNKLNFKSFIAGILFCVMAFSILTVYAESVTKSLQVTFNDIKIKINGEEITPKDANGNVIHPFIADGSTYLPVRAVADAVGYDVGWDGTTKTVLLSESGLKAELDNYTPEKNQTINLTVTGKELEGLSYTALCYYKTTQTEYSGVVGQPCAIKVSSATADFTVLIYIVVHDEKNNEKYELYTSFKPQ